MRRAAMVGLAACCLAAAGCGGTHHRHAGQPTSTTHAAAAPLDDIPGNWDGERIAVRLTLLRAGDLAQVRLLVTNHGGGNLQVGQTLDGAAGSSGGGDSAGGIALIEPGSGLRIAPARTAAGGCACATDLDDDFLNSGQSTTISATFQVADLGEPTVFVPDLGTFVDVVATHAAIGAAQGAAQAESSALALSPVSLVDRPQAIVDAPVPTYEAAGRSIRLSSDVLFAFARSNLSPAAHALIARAVARIRSVRPRVVLVDGYTDSIGSVAYNLGLSRRRANAVTAALRTALGAGGPRLVPQGFGEADPIAPNHLPDGADNPAGRAQNRRVALHLNG